MSTLSCVPPGLECVRQKGKKYIVLSRMGVYLATRGSKHCSFMRMGSINTDRNDCRNNESADLKGLPRKCDYCKKVQASSMINGDTNILGNKEICHFLRQSIKQHVQMFPKQLKDGLLWRSSGWPGFNISDEALKDLWSRADQVIREMLVHFSPQFAACEADHLQDEKKCFRARRAKLRSLSGTPAECAFKNRDVLASPHGACFTTRRWQQMFGALAANKRVCPLRLLSAHSKH